MNTRKENLKNVLLSMVIILSLLILFDMNLMANNGNISLINLSDGNLGLTNLRVEYKANPIGIDIMQPRLSWEIISSKRNFLQIAYQIKTSRSEENLIADRNLLWNSGKISSDQSNQVIYEGPKLESGERVYWQVKIWGIDGSESSWSNTSFWEMGFLNANDWKAKWIEADLNEEPYKYYPSPMFRKDFIAAKKIINARAYITSHGLYELHINGEKIGDQLFTPGWTSYNKRLQYQTYDITRELREGKNAIGVLLADGWYRNFRGYDKRKLFYGDKLALLFEIIIEYSDGTKETIISDSSWKSSTGPILMSSIYDGETYDARLEKIGWDKTDYNDSEWKKVVERNCSKEILVAQEGPPVRVTEIIKPIKKLKATNGDVILDMGQNMVGYLQFSLKGETGMKITLKHAEVLDQKGNLYTENLRSAEQKIEYTFKGAEVETYEPHFTFQGFRYVSVTNYTGEISVDNFVGKVIHSNMTPTGIFECSDSLVNKLQHNIQWGLKGNFIDVPTDCPQRDERLGWTGDAQAFAPTACFNVDASSFYTKWMKDFIADQKKDGAIPWVIPDIFDPKCIDGTSKNNAATGWADAGVIIPWTIYQNYGDKRILDIQYESMKKWIDYMSKQTGDSYLWKTGFHFGDWLAFTTTQSDYPGATTDKDLIATAYFYHSTSILQKTAETLGKKEDAQKFSVLMKNIKDAFQKEFITLNGRISSNTQTAYVLALAFDLFPENLKANAAKRLADDVKKFGHITTGFLGTPLICEVLSQNGYNDLAFMLLFRKQYPSWLYPITIGATTIWERWDGIKPNGTFQDKEMNSFNHYAYGAIGKWLYSHVAGIQINPDEPGYKKIIINPDFSSSLSFANAEYHSIYGKIISRWKVDKTNFVLDVEIPANTSAEIFLPSVKKENIFEGNKPLMHQNEMQVKEISGGKTVLCVGSGVYHFAIDK